MHRTYRFLCVAGLMLALLVPGLAHGATAAQPTIGLIMKTLTNPFFIAMEKGARQAEKDLNVGLVVKTGAKETSIDQQIGIVEDMIRDKVAAIVIAPGSSTELVPVLRKAQAAKIVIVNIDNRLDPVLSQRMGLVHVPFISVNNVHGAFLATQALTQGAPAGTEAAILEGIRSAANGQQRLEGALKGFKAQPTVRVVASETANWKIDEAMMVTTKLLRDHPQLNLLFCSNDMMALGAIQALQSAGNTKVKVAGFDALEEALQAIRQGKLVATIDQQAAEQGYRGIRAAVDLMQGKTVPSETLVDVKLITRASLL
jgi:ribose transport system substrate-binding protein